MWYSQAKTWLVSRLFASTNRCLGWSWSNINPGYFWLASLQTCIILFNLTINILLEFILAQYHFYKNTNYSLFLKKSESPSVVSDSLWPPWTIQSMEFSRPEWVTFPFFRGSSQLRDQTQDSCIAGRFSTTRATREAPVPYRLFF